MSFAGPQHAFHQRVRARREHGIAVVASARKRRRPDAEGHTDGRVGHQAGDARSERKLAQQAEASYQQTVRDWQAAAPKKLGASVTPGRASQKPSKGKVTRQTTSP